MVKIKIDGVEYEVDEKKNLISAVAEIGIEIPHFCYHPKLSVVGMCRMCLIEIEGVPKLQAACNTQVRDGLSIITKSDRVTEAREGTMEFLLANHPLDCPVCDKAGECMLQDNSFGSGKGASRFEFKKRNIPQEEIGDNLIINHNRCIVCYRCVRFEEEIVGESNLGLFERGYHSIIGLAKNEPIHHNYQGALADICPVGALLNHKTLFKSRVWWYKKAKSICPGCSTGCHIETNVRDNKMYRYMPRINEDEDMYFICDKGRFDVDWLNENRLLYYAKAGQQSESTTVIPAIAEEMNNARKIAVLGGASESNENLKKILESIKSLKTELVLEARVQSGQVGEPKQVDFLYTTDNRPNTRGAVDNGFISKSGIEEILSQIKSGNIDLVFVIKENEIANQVLELGGTVVVLETNETDSVSSSSYAIPIKAFCEEAGSFTNKSGKLGEFEQSMKPPRGLLSSGEFFQRLIKETEIQQKMEVTAVGNH